jgi:hypothetical protein
MPERNTKKIELIIGCSTGVLQEMSFVGALEG